ncbi:MAG TPA: hypothetical protein VF733_03715, partial [Candidatus Saccharimonadales bacterium]
RIRAARLAFAQKNPPGAQAELAGMDAPISTIALINSVADTPVLESTQARWFEEASLEAAAKAAKDEAGVERHLVGPISLEKGDLGTFLWTAEYIGASVSEEMVELQKEIDEVTADRGIYLAQEDRMNELLTYKAAASSIAAAIHSYVTPKIIE